MLISFPARGAVKNLLDNVKVWLSQVRSVSWQSHEALCLLVDNIELQRFWIKKSPLCKRLSLADAVVAQVL